MFIDVFQKEVNLVSLCSSRKTDEQFAYRETDRVDSTCTQTRVTSYTDKYAGDGSSWSSEYIVFKIQEIFIWLSSQNNCE